MKRSSEAWAPPCGGKGNRPFQRPLLPFFISLILGILITHEVLPGGGASALAVLFLFLLVCLLSFPFLPRGARAWFLVMVFFLTGALLGRESDLPSRLTHLVDQNRSVIIEGTVLDPPRTTGDRIARLTLRARELILDRGMTPLNENITVTVYGHIPDLEPGDKIRFPARLRSFRNFNNPGGYDYKGAMRLKGLTCGASVSDGRRIVPMGPGRLPFPRNLVERMQRPVRDLFRRELTPRDCALFRAIILGERHGLDPGLRELFNRTGLGHILAVSGLHIGLVAWAAFIFFKWLLSRSYRLALEVNIRKVAALLTAFPVVGYSLLAGFQVPARRAMIMILTYLLSIIVGRERDLWSTLALAGLIILFLEPMALFSLSFQLSFLAVTGILWLTPRIVGLFRSGDASGYGGRSIFSRVTAYVGGLAGVTVAATVFLLPVICHYFHRISPVSIPANLTAVPILGMWIIPLGLLSAISAFFTKGLASLFIQMGAWGLDTMMDIVRFWAGLPWTTIWTVTPNLFEILLFYSLILCISLLGRARWALPGLVFTLALVAGDAAYWIHRVRFNKDLAVDFLDVGQGNAALVVFPGGKKMIIDGGGFYRGSFDVGRMVVAPCLWHNKIAHIDYMVLSHPQADHMKGLIFLARAFGPGEFWYNGDRVKTPAFGELMRVVERRGIKVLLPSHLARGVEINGARVQVLYPVSDGKEVGDEGRGKDLNNNSLVLKLTYRGRSFLFPGDLERPGELALLAYRGEMVRSDVLLSPHHGSRTSSSAEFLQAVRPSLCVVSSREGGSGNFPHHTVIERLLAMGCRVIRISREGAVEITVGKDLFRVKTFLHGEVMASFPAPAEDAHPLRP